MITGEESVPNVEKSIERGEARGRGGDGDGDGDEGERRNWYRP